MDKIKHKYWKKNISLCHVFCGEYHRQLEMKPGKNGWLQTLRLT
jgi:hypothetical protein